MALLLAGALGIFLVLLYAENPATSRLYPPCPFRLLTGLHCPGCGSLRALHNLLHGRVQAALSLNPLMVVSLPILGIMLGNPAWIYRRWVPWVSLGVLVGYGILRNIPFRPFLLLAPH